MRSRGIITNRAGDQAIAAHAQTLGQAGDRPLVGWQTVRSDHLVVERNASRDFAQIDKALFPNDVATPDRKVSISAHIDFVARRNQVGNTVFYVVVGTYPLRNRAPPCRCCRH